MAPWPSRAMMVMVAVGLLLAFPRSTPARIEAAPDESAVEPAAGSIRGTAADTDASADASTAVDSDAVDEPSTAAALAIVEGWADFAAFAQLYNQSRRMPGVGVAEWVGAAERARGSALAPPPATSASAGALIGGYERLTRMTERRANDEPRVVEALRARYLVLAEEIVALWTLEDFGGETFEQLESSDRGVGARVVDVFYRQYRYLLYGGLDLDAARSEAAKLDGLATGFSRAALKSFEVLVEAYFREIGRSRTASEVSGRGAFAFQQRLRDDVAGWNPALALVAVEALVERGPHGMDTLMSGRSEGTPSERRYRERLNWDDLTAAVDPLLVQTLVACLRAERPVVVDRAGRALDALLLGEEFQRPRLTLRRSSVPLAAALDDVGVAAATKLPPARTRLDEAIRLLGLLDTDPAANARKHLLGLRDEAPAGAAEPGTAE